jgi:cyclic beta-1,2-glucan synthetase
MDAAMQMLVDEDEQLIRLFTPPFHDTPKEPGYIKSYPPGVRENGGQYTHAATWFVIALAEMGRADEAWHCYRLLNPITHARDEASAERYRVEPYVVAADVYSGGEKGGRGGWTWYTGSAGWMYRAGVEGILGLRKRGSTLSIKPSLPSAWQGFSAALKHGGSTLRIRVERAGDAQAGLFVDGRKLDGTTVDLDAAGDRDVLLRV